MSDLEGRGFLRRGNTLVPADQFAEEWLQSLPENREILFSYRKPRSVPQHRRFFAILQKAVENLPQYDDVDTLLDVIKIACFHVRQVVTAKGEIVMLPKSINFASMDATTYQRFEKRALVVLGNLLDVDPESLLKEIE